MIKLCFCSLVFIVFSNGLFGQKRENHLKIHGEAAVPMGDFGDSYNTGWGIHLTDYYQMVKDGSLVLSIGINSWHAKDVDLTGGIVQVKVGYRHFVYSGFYAQGDGGLGKYVGKWGSGSQFTYGGKLGYLVRVKNDNGVDIHTGINRISYRTWISLGIGYQF